MILDALTFREKLLPKYYRHDRITSFNKQLNLYGFKRVYGGVEKGSFYHPTFRRGNRKQVGEMKKKGNVTTSEAPSDGKEEVPISAIVSRQQSGESLHSISQSVPITQDTDHVDRIIELLGIATSGKHSLTDHTDYSLYKRHDHHSYERDQMTVTGVTPPHDLMKVVQTETNFKDLFDHDDSSKEGSLDVL
jgi:hypothetical protein